MVNVRIQHGSRLNVLLTQDRPYAGEHWTAQLPRLLEPQGVAAYIAHNVREAMDFAEHMPIHAAVIDVGIPMGEGHRRATPASRMPGQAKPTSAGGGSGVPSGLWLLELFRRLPNRPPIIVIHSAAFDRKQIERIVHQALRLGAFSVVAKPVGIEQILAIFRRLVDRQYQGGWPTPPGSPAPGSPAPGSPGSSEGEERSSGGVH